MNTLAALRQTGQIPVIEVEHSSPQIAVAEDVIVFGRAHGKTFKPMSQRGILVERMVDDEFVYFDISEVPDFPMPREADNRLFLVGSHYPLKQIVIAKEIKGSEIDWKQIARAALVVAGAIATVVAVVGVAAVEVALSDPKLIVVLDAPLEGYPWVSICEWL